MIDSKARNKLPAVAATTLALASLYFLANSSLPYAYLPTEVVDTVARFVTSPSSDVEANAAPLTSRLLAKRAPIQAEYSRSSFSSIPIDASLPSTSDFSTSAAALVETWDAALKSLAVAARTETGAQATKGIPGTGIKSSAEAKELQEHLDCMSGKGEWVYDERGEERQKGNAAGLTVHKHSGVLASCDRAFLKHAHPDDEAGWAVRESLKYRWVPSSTCAASAPKDAAAPPSPLSRRALCTYLAHKATVLVGDVPQYVLHDLLLDWTALEPFSCYGDLYCKEHLLCADVLRHSSLTEIENWTSDERVFERMPDGPVPADFGTKKAQKKEKNPSHGTMLRYRRVDGMRASTNFAGPTYIHPATGVREVNQPWLADARRSDIVILNKAPLPFPVVGNNATFDEWFGQKEDPIEAGIKLIEAAWRLTEDVWLPEVMETIKLLRTRPTPGDILLVYRGTWRAHGDCGVDVMTASNDEDEWTSPGDGPPPLALPPTLRNLLFRSLSSTSLVLKELHTTFHNIQTVLQNHLLRTVVLPHFGIPFLDLEAPLSVWRSGLVGGSVSRPFQFVDQSSQQQHDQLDFGSQGSNIGLRSSASGDCLRYCLPSPGMALEEAFLGGLVRIFERGWGTKDRLKDWVGADFVDIKGREKARGTPVG